MYDYIYIYICLIVNLIQPEKFIEEKKKNSMEIFVACNYLTPLLYTYIHTYILHTCIHIHTHILHQIYIHTYIHTYQLTNIHT